MKERASWYTLPSGRSHTHTLSRLSIMELLALKIRDRLGENLELTPPNGRQPLICASLRYLKAGDLVEQYLGQEQPLGIHRESISAQEKVPQRGDCRQPLLPIMRSFFRQDMLDPAYREGWKVSVSTGSGKGK